MSDKSEQTLHSELVYRGKFIALRKDTVQLPNGRTSIREVVEHPGAVCVIAETDDRRVLLVHQYRYAIGRHTWELPAGKLEPGEHPPAAALRELSEETGYETSGAVMPVLEFYATPGFSDEKMYLYYARSLTKGTMHPDEDEFVDVFGYGRQEVLTMLQNGDVNDAKTIVGLYWWLARDSDRT